MRYSNVVYDDVGRTNIWACIIYPGDSAPDNYLNIIQNWHVAAAVSPLHEPDLEAGEYESAKKHIHIMLDFGSGANKSADQLEIFREQVKGTRFFRVNSRNGYLRYLIHLDDPNKQQFNRDPSNILFFSGFDVKGAFDNNAREDEEIYDWFEDLLIEKGFFNMRQLLEFLKAGNFPAELRFFRSHSFYLSNLLTGNYQHIKSKLNGIVDKFGNVSE